MDAIIFSSYIPQSDRLYIGKEYLDIFKDFYSDCDIYIGINPDTIPEWFDMIDEYKKYLNISYDFVKPELYTRSDASGFQNGLLQLKNSGKKYDIIWFGHTKGGHYNDNIRKDQRNWMYQNFWANREGITKELQSNSRFGAYAHTMTKTGKRGVSDPLDQFYNFKYSCIDVFYVYTFYCIKGHIVDEFIQNCNITFFEKHLRDYGFDRFFFERDFPHIVSKQGYEFAYGVLSNIWKNNTINKEIYGQLLKEWKQRNGIK